jgi:hypothetical protein
MCKAHTAQSRKAKQKMARIYIKAIVSVDMPEPQVPLEKSKPKLHNEEMREYAREKILEALDAAGLNPSIQRINLSRPIKDSTNE